MRHALQAYALGNAKTMAEAAAMVGCHPVSVRLAAQSPAGKAVMDSAYQIIADKQLSASEMIQKLSRRAVEVVATTMEDSKDETIRLKAAADLLDRNPETSKTSKVQADVFTLSGKDAQGIAAALVQAATLSQQFPDAVGNYVKVDTEASLNVPQLPPGLSHDSERRDEQPGPSGSGEP